MKKLQKNIYSAIVVSEVSHVFCCVLPTVFSVVSLMAGVGMVSVVPLWLQNIHDTLHEWEIPLIIMSAFILVFGWVLHIYSYKIDCHDTGCGHGPCEPAKNKTHIILKVATILFLVNVTVYMVFHRGMSSFTANGVENVSVEMDATSDGHDHHAH